MSIVLRFRLVFLLLLGLCATGWGQASDGPLAATTVQNSNQIVAYRPPVDGQHVVNMPASSVVLDAGSGSAVAATSFANFNPSQNGNDNSQGNESGITLRPNVSTIDQLDTIATFDGAFVAQAGPDTDEDFRFTMAGNNPRMAAPQCFRA